MSNRNGGHLMAPSAFRWGKERHEKNGGVLGGRTNSSRQRKHGGNGKSRKGRR